jgi:Zn-dependent M28 family amino/carboxypeptidase
MHVLGIDCSWYLHEEGFAPGLLCSTFPESGSEDHVIISAHIDSRGTFGNLRAPGADDDGSGSAHLLAIARAISKHNVTFEHPVTLAFFTGEEQGLVMSNHFAHTLKKENISVQLNIQADMLGYRVPGEPLQLALPAT